MGRYLGKVFFTALSGHGVGLLLLLVFSFLGKELEDPSAAILPAAFVALGAGAAVAGLLARRMTASLPGALLVGVAYGLIPLAVSLFGSSSFFHWGTRALVFFLAVVVTVAVALLFPKKKRRKKGRKNPFPVRH